MRLIFGLNNDFTTVLRWSGVVCGVLRFSIASCGVLRWSAVSCGFQTYPQSQGPEIRQ